MKEFIYNNKIWLSIIIILILIILGLLITYIYFNYYDIPDLEIIEINYDYDEYEEEIEYIEEIKYIYVDIKGSVKNPGVYKIEENTIVNDLIKIAGGLTTTAITTNLNLSKKLANEMVIYVYDDSDYIIKDSCIVVELTEQAIEDSNIKSEELYYNNDNDYNDDLDEVISIININIASLEELMTLSGIGESKALAIIEYRETQKFESIEDLKNISGIGDATFDTIKDIITV